MCTMWKVQKAFVGRKQQKEEKEKDSDAFTYWFFTLKHFWFPPAPGLHPYGCICVV